MTHMSRTKIIALLVFAVTAVAAVSQAQSLPPLAEQVAKMYGLDSFGQIEAIRYTFNVQFPSVNVSRSWEWEPKTGKVTFDGKDKSGKPLKVTYLRSQLSSQPADVKDYVDPSFVNDQYWLIFPLHVVWDKGADVKDMGRQNLPIGKGTADQLVVKYGGNGGYTPGDTWELFVTPDHRVEQFIYRRGGPVKPSEVIATWEGYKNAGPLLIATEHRGTADGKPFHLAFTNVSVKLTGSDTWLNAK